MDLTDIIKYMLAFLAGGFIMMWQNEILRAWVMRRTSKSDIGLIGMITSTRQIYLSIQRFTEPIYKVANYSFDPKKKFPKAIFSIRDVPIKFYSEVDTDPLNLDPLQKDERLRNDPNALSGAFLQYRALIKHEEEMKQKYLLYGVIGTLLGIIIVAYLVNGINGQLGNLNAGMGTLIQLVNQTKGV